MKHFYISIWDARKPLYESSDTWRFMCACAEGWTKAEIARVNEILAEEIAHPPVLLR